MTSFGRSPKELSKELRVVETANDSDFSSHVILKRAKVSGEGMQPTEKWLVLDPVYADD